MSEIEPTFAESERPTRPTQPPTMNDLIQALAGTNELIIRLQSTLEDVLRQGRDHEKRLTWCEAELAAE